jgi:hypothetical protein
MMDDVPHIKLPIEIAGRAYATVQQDTDDELACTVAAIAQFPYGYRIEAPEFGVDPLEFEVQPLDVTGLEQACEVYEPRARLVLAVSDFNPIDPAASRVQISVSMLTSEDL